VDKEDIIIKMIDEQNKTVNEKFNSINKEIKNIDEKFNSINKEIKNINENHLAHIEEYIAILKDRDKRYDKLTNK
jgi:vacuolar-type H+-ATPase subunit I/STV1